MAIALRREANLLVDMPDGSTWSVPVKHIAKHRATHYKAEYGHNVQRSLDEDTWPLFMSDKSEVKDWAANNMNWEDVEDVAVLVTPPSPMTPETFQEGWINGDQRIV